jgi:hypothetical protein
MSLSVYFLPDVPRVVVIAFEGAQTLDVTGPAEVFAAAGRARPDEATYRVVFASLGGGERTLSSGLRMRTRDLGRTGHVQGLRSFEGDHDHARHVWQKIDR